MSKRVLAMALAILAFFIFVGSPFGQSAKAIVGVDDAIIAIIIAALAAMGITFVVGASYGSLEDYVGDLIEEYAESRNMTSTELFVGVQSGSNRTGQLLLNNRFVQVISTFGEWVKAKFGLQDNTRYNVQSGNTTWGGLTVYQMPFSIVYVGFVENEYSVYRSSGQSVYVALRIADNGSYITPWFLSKGSAQIQVVHYYDSGEIVSDPPVELLYSQDKDCYISYGAAYNRNYSNIWSLTSYTEAQLNAALNGSISEGGANIDIQTGTIALPTEGDALDDKGAILDVGAAWGIGYDDITDIVIPGDFSDSRASETTITYEDEQVVQEQVEDTPAAQVSQDVEDYRTPGLPDVFPFCIPFDIYAFFECLAADPVAPSFMWRFYIPGICDEELEIDLSAFDSAARILRTMELLLFIVGLAFVTRDKFLRG